jgi:hypothetical protein
MYIIINKTHRKEFKIEGGWPDGLIEHMLNQGDDIIVISTYSNTIKIPIGLKDVSNVLWRSDVEWEWKEYTYSTEWFTHKPYEE